MLSVLRIVTALLYIEHGTQKLFNFPPAKTAMVFDILSRQSVAGILETMGGMAILFGLFTRPIAFILAGEMAVAYFTIHLARSFYPVINAGDNAILFCFIFLYLVFAGAGVWSVDDVLETSRRRRRVRGQL
jgi:putative oxidoreductase